MIRTINCSGTPFRRSLRPTAAELAERLDARRQTRLIAAGGDSSGSGPEGGMPSAVPLTAEVSTPAYGWGGSSILALGWGGSSDLALEMSLVIAKATALLGMLFMSGLLSPLMRRCRRRARTQSVIRVKPKPSVQNALHRENVIRPP